MTVAYDPTSSYDVQARDMEYRRFGDVALLARIYQPQGAGPFPLLLDVHGGQWADMNDRTNNATFDGKLAATGMVVVAIDLRATPRFHYPDPVQDVNYAVRLLKEQAADLNADATTLGAFGGSSGGHLVLLSAMRCRDPRYLEPAAGVGDDALVAYLACRAPISDPYARYLMAQRMERHDIVHHTELFFQPWETIFDANPQRILETGGFELLPPLLIVQGSEDENIERAIQQRFVDSYQAAGGDVRFDVFEGMPHLFAKWSPEALDGAVGRTAAFIAGVLSQSQSPVGQSR